MRSNSLSPIVLEEAAARVAAGEKLCNLIGQLGVSRRTLFRWKARDDFRRRVCDLRAEMTRDTCGRLAASMANAAETLTGLLGHEDAGVRLRAAQQVLALGTKLRDAVEVDERLETLEQQLVKAK